MEWPVDHSQVICDKIILAYLKQSTFARQLVYPFTYLSEIQFVVCLCVLSGIKMFYNWLRKVKLLGQGSGIFKVKQCTLSSFFTKSVVDEIELKLKDSFECDVHDNDVER